MAAVLPALQEAVILDDLTFGERDVLVGAAVTDGVDIVTDADDCHGDPFDVEAPCLASCQVLEPAEGDRVTVHSTERRAMVRAGGLATYHLAIVDPDLAGAS